MPNENLWGSEQLESWVKKVNAAEVKLIDEGVKIDVKKKNKMDELKKRVEDLLSKNPSLKAWFDKVAWKWIQTIGGASSYQIFFGEKVLSLDESVVKGLTEDDLDEMYRVWNKERLAKLKSWLSYSNLELFSLNYQKNYLSNWENTKKKGEFLKKLDKTLKNQGAVENAIDLFYGYSLTEIVWEVILNVNLNSPEWLRSVQLLASLFVVEDKPFEIKVDGLYWPQTWTFLDMLLNNPDFINSTNWTEYANKIKAFLRWRKSFKWRYKNLYRSFSDVSARMEQYTKDPVNYWRQQSVYSEHFVWVEASKTPYPSIDSMTKTDESFIKRNRNSVLDSELSELFDARGKSPEQIKEISERLQSLMPKEDLRKHLTKFLKNEKVRQEFSDFFKLPSTTLDDPILVETLLNDRWWQEWTQKIRDWITSWMWASVGEDLTSLSVDIQSYIREQCGLSALSVKTKFLEWVFWEWTTFEPVDREVKKNPSDLDYPIYFRDKNNPSMVYEYRPNTWDIYAEKYYGTANWALTFWKWREGQAPIKIHTMKANFSDFMKNISVLDLLPKERSETRIALKDAIAKNIESHMNYTVESDESANMKSKNDLMRLKNWAVDSALNMFWLIDSTKEPWDADAAITLTEDENGPYFHLMSRLIASVDWASESDLKLLNTFLSDLSGKVKNADSIDLKSVNNPLIRFILSEQKWLRVYWDDKVKVNNKSEEWKKKDLLLWTVMDSLFVDGKLDFDRVRILNDGVSNSKYREIALRIESDYNEKAKQNEISVVSQMIGEDLYALQQDVAVSEHYDAALNEAYS